MLKLVYEQLHKTGEWVKTNPAEAAKILSPLWGNLDVATVETANTHRSYQVQPVKGDQLGEQQKIADAFFAAGLLPKAVDAKDVEIWKP
ncbi:alkanesulfonate transporter substrate-binding subunit [compost metagenome]